MKTKKFEFTKNEFVSQYEQLILHALVLPGERLPSERELAQQFGVSRPAVHEGLLALCAKGLITMRPRHGCIVNNVHKEGAFNLLESLYSFDSGSFSDEIDTGLEELRLMLLEKAVKSCCKKMDTAKKNKAHSTPYAEETADFIEKLRQSACIDPALTPKKKAAADFEFYRLLIEFSLNKVFLLLYNSGKTLYLQKLTDFFGTQPDVTQKTNELKAQLTESLFAIETNEALKIIHNLAVYKTYEDE